MKKTIETKDKLHESTELCEQMGSLLKQLPEAAQRDLLMYVAGYKMAYAPKDPDGKSA